MAIIQTWELGVVPVLDKLAQVVFCWLMMMLEFVKLPLLLKETILRQVGKLHFAVVVVDL